MYHLRRMISSWLTDDGRLRSGVLQIEWLLL
jgi:hypothetical protein